MDDSCIVAFTSQPLAMMMASRSCTDWKLDARRSREAKYLVCAWNSRGDHATAAENAFRNHGELFMVAPIASIRSSTTNPDRRTIFIESIARVSIPHVGQRNPIHYTALSDLGIDADKLTFEPIGSLPAAPVPDAGAVLPLTIPVAKLGLALFYGVAPSAIEITIRG